jgi:hypothetical protein
MATFEGAGRYRRRAAGLALALLLAAGCGGGDTGAEDGGGAPSSAPAAEGPLRLTEDVPQDVATGSGDPVPVVLTGFEDGDDPAAVLDVGAGGEAREHTLRLGDTVDVGGTAWRVSEIGIGADGGQPGGVTLTRG